MSDRILTVSTVSCPACGARQRELMPLIRCERIHYCFRCGTIARPKPSACCVYCAWGDVPCPPAQRAWRQWRQDRERKDGSW